jgi:DNA-binding transcriptional regulator YhcF (GntR family)
MTIEWTGLGPDLLLHLDRDAAEPLRTQLERELRDAIRGGRLRTGVRLPASRALAAQLGVSRGVVTDAYEQLSAEGWLAARRGAGTVVAAAPAAEPPPTPPSPPPTAGAAIERVQERWQEAILPEIGRQSPPLFALLASARPVALEDDAVTIAFPRTKLFDKAGAEKPANAAVIAAVVGQAVGRELSARIVFDEAEEQPAAAAKDDEPPPDVSEDELFARIKETFDAHEVKETR